MKKTVLLLTTISFLLINFPLAAQVTIGVGEAPATGSLLQLKEEAGILDGSANAHKGIMLPRVNLTKLKPSTPNEFSESIGNIGSWDMDKHIGLTVYNVNDTCISAGVYTWNGQQWLRLPKYNRGSYESDVEALIELYNSNKGNTLNWNISGDPLKWSGVVWQQDPICKEYRVKQLFFNNRNLTSADGINKLEKLTYLDCQYNQLSVLDMSQNTELTNLDCSYNQLTALKVVENTELAYFNCAGNQLTDLDVTRNPKLLYLTCTSNQLTSLDVTQNSTLVYFVCSLNRLTEIDVSQNTALTSLSIFSNQLTSLDVSQNTELKTLLCSTNNLKELNIEHNPNLTTLACNSNEIETLDVSQNLALTSLECNYNQLADLDVSQNTALVTLRCTYNQLTTLDISQNSVLKNFDCSYNWMSQAAVHNLKIIHPSYCGITTRNITPQYIPNSTTIATGITAPTCP